MFYRGAKTTKDNREREREQIISHHKITEQSAQTALVIITRRVLNQFHVQTFPLLAKDIMHGSLGDSRFEYEIRDA